MKRSSIEFCHFRNRYEYELTVNNEKFTLYNKRHILFHFPAHKNDSTNLLEDKHYFKKINKEISQFFKNKIYRSRSFLQT